MLTAVVLGAALLASEPTRRVSLCILRFPFTMTRAVVVTLSALPQAPMLARDNARLQAQLTRRDFELAQLREALRHVQASRELTEAIPQAQGVVAVVLARSILPTQHTVLLDKGERDGVVLESLLLDATGVVGRVIEMHPTTCVGLLLTDPESRVAGLVERSRDMGLLVGRGQGLCEFIYLDAEADLQEGDRVLTAGLGGVVPKGLVLGTVTGVGRDAQAGTAWARVRPAARLGRLEEVLCIPPRSGRSREGG